jgi:hypothetical protein
MVGVIVAAQSVSGRYLQMVGVIVREVPSNGRCDCGSPVSQYISTVGIVKEGVDSEQREGGGTTHTTVVFAAVVHSSCHVANVTIRCV